MSNDLLRSLLSGDNISNPRIGRVVDKLKPGLQHLSDYVEHVISPSDTPPMPCPYGVTGGAEQVIISTANTTFIQPAGYAGFVAFSPSYASGTATIIATRAGYVQQDIQTSAGAGLTTKSIVGSPFTEEQFELPTTTGNTNTGGLKAKWTACFFRVRCIDNVQDRGGDGFIGQTSQQGGVDCNGVDSNSFNNLMQQQLIKKLLVNGEWNDWHCTCYEQDLRFADVQYPFPSAGLASIVTDDTVTFERVSPYFCYLYPNTTAHTWEVEIYFTFEVDGNVGTTLTAAPVQPNVSHIPHLPAAANINAAIAYARSKVGAGNTKHTSFGQHCRNFFKSIGHDITHEAGNVFRDALDASAFAAGAALFA